MLSSMEDGEISISAYDTAWVALVEDVNGTCSPHFPSSLEWIANNQLEDGSWGYKDVFSAHDRIISTLACVVALKSWSLHPDKCDKGMRFFRENLDKIEDENSEHMPIGFEVAFPSVLEIARSLNLEVPDESPVLHEIYACRNLKLSKIPRDILHNVATSLLYSLEGMAGLDWEKLLKLQSRDGSFLFSPASTAYALQQTNDQNCMSYLSRIVHKFNGGVPSVYPVDLFERMWAVDRLQRLGLSRYFEPEIKECVRYVSRYWTDKGISWVRNSEVPDIDDTSMGFRLLRLHGHKVSAEVYEYFKKGSEFFCYPGQSSQAVTGIYNLYRASQLALPEEKILGDAKEFATKFLREKQASNELLDKWMIIKDLPGEGGERNYVAGNPKHAADVVVELKERERAPAEMFVVASKGGEGPRDQRSIGRRLSSAFSMQFDSSEVAPTGVSWSSSGVEIADRGEIESRPATWRERERERERERVEWHGFNFLIIRRAKLSFRFRLGKKKWQIRTFLLRCRYPHLSKVGYALDFPWYASLPRLETIFYIEQYGGEDDVWIGKTLYSMPYISNNVYLELAKLDYNNCQALHLKEWDNIQKWYKEWKLEDYGLSEKSLLTAYFVAAASIFEPERANERLAWAKTVCLVDIIVSYFKGETYDEDKKAFIDEFKTFSNMRDYENARRSSTNKTAGQGIVGALLATLSQLSSVTMALHHQDITESLSQAWEKWLLKWQEKGERYQDEAELLVETINQTAGLSLRQKLLSAAPEYEQLFGLTNKVCNQLRCCENQKNKVNGNCRTKINMTTPEIGSYMQQLVELVLEKSSDDIESLIKQSFFTVARSFYYSTCCDPEVISHHINKVLFQQAI
ncbi:putative ent-copalyl diphosphate synthase [Rosa chinensis]|uniref:Putative ent-copalyl diphosphate synthase n=1 Tax=Rosa chinensis TaxID=74649 RepID=A0A2P6PW04_ROSCH|nr:putative ent-copalyl diphosphate synthase [Rosa chinensis]